MELPFLPRLPSLDLSLRIFTSLDAKSIAISKCVSKKWLRFLSHPDFVTFYSRLRPTTMTGFFYRSSEKYREKLRYVSVGGADDHEPVAEPSSCLGFLLTPAILYDSAGGLLHWATSWNDRFISNPVTQEVITLDWDFERIEFFACGIAYDPSDPVHFEIVVLVMKPNLNLEPSIFNSETKEWTKSEEIKLRNPRRLVPYEESRGIFLEGSLYWETKQNKILCYKVEERSARIIELPQHPQQIRNQIGLLSILDDSDRFNSQGRGCLGMRCGVLHYGLIRNRTLSIWFYSDRFNRWEVQRSIVFDNVEVSPNQLLAFAEDCESVWMSMEKKIVHWYFNGGIKGDFEVQRVGDDCVGPSSFFPFLRSFALCERVDAL